MNWLTCVRSSVILRALLLGVSSGAVLAQGNLLVNGSFEEPDSSSSPVSWGFTYGLPLDPDPAFYRGPGIPGWNIANGTIDVKRTYWQNAPGQGNQSIDLVGSPGAASIWQTFATVPGQDYVFSGWVSHNPGIPFGAAQVFLSGAPPTQLVHATPNTEADMRWQFFAHRFRATAPTTTLTIADVTGLWDFGGTALDGLLITRAAEQDNLTASPARLYVSSIDGTPSSSDQVEISVGQCITLTYIIRTRTGGVLDVTNSPTTTFFTDPARGEFRQQNTFCATEAERNTVLTVYARYQDPVTGQSVTDGIIVKIRR